MTVHIHGGKHQVDVVRDTITNLINEIDHDTIVDPFVGSGTFVKSDKRAKRSIINFLGVSHEVAESVVDNLPQDNATISYLHAIDFLTMRDGRDTKSLLLLDPPRPDSKQYEVAWSQTDMGALLGIAYAWKGPVIYTGYTEDSPPFRGAGWKTITPRVPFISEVAGEEELTPFVSYRDTHIIDPEVVAKDYSDLHGISQRLGSTLLFHSAHSDILDSALTIAAQLEKVEAEDVRIAIAHAIAVLYRYEKEKE